MRIQCSHPEMVRAENSFADPHSNMHPGCYFVRPQKFDDTTSLAPAAAEVAQQAFHAAYSALY
jgi:hypothetical protein